MSKKIILGPGGCGFLRINKMLNEIGIQTRYKGGRVKFQNGFEIWNSQTGLIWDLTNKTENERYLLAKNYYDNLPGEVVEISHIPIKYVRELISIDNNIKFVCIIPKSRKHSILSLFHHWGYRNPIKTKRNEYRARYVLEQFPDYSHLDFFAATEAYWDEYSHLAEELQKQYPKNFMITDSIPLFEPVTDGGKSREKFADFFGCNAFVNSESFPVDKDFVLTSTLHGGLGNNLFQMSEGIAFAAEHGLKNPVFGTWKLQHGNNLFPPHYNADAFLGRHTGTHEDFRSTFSNINWQNEIEPTYDTKFLINDMFDFSRVNHMKEKILEAFKPSEKVVQFINEKYKDLFDKETTSLHLRTCTLPADNHVNGNIPFEFHITTLGQLSDDMNVLVFSDNNSIAENYITKLKQVSNKNFILINENQFVSIFMMAKCTHHILHVSTMSFWGAYLADCWPDKKGKTFYHENFNKCHTDRMIPKELEWIMIK